MRFGFAPSGTREAATAVRLASAAEAAGFDEVWVSEDYLERGAFAVAGAIAASTNRVGIGLGVINPWTRHVALTAMECAALDELSGGRLVLGLGTSNPNWMQEQLGIPHERPVSRMLEYADAFRDLIAGRELDRTVGDHRVHTSLAFDPPRPAIPVVFGVKRPRALRRSSGAGNGVMLSVLSSPAYVTWVRDTFAPPAITAYAFFSCDQDAALARRAVTARTARFLGIHGPSPITEHAGIDAELAGEFQRRLRSGEQAEELVSDAILDAVTISGDVAGCVAGIERFAATGLDSLVLVDDGSGNPDAMLATAADAIGRVTSASA